MKILLVPELETNYNARLRFAYRVACKPKEYEQNEVQSWQKQKKEIELK